MRTIYKYQLQITDAQVIYMPPNSTVISVAVQDGFLYCWAAVDIFPGDETELFTVTIRIYGTGQPLEMDAPLLGRYERFIGTVLMPPFVWHVFQVYGGVTEC